MQTIETVYLGPTDTKPGRIRAKSSGGGSVIISYAHDATTTEAAHALAAGKLRQKYGWGRMYLAGSTKRGFVFAFPPAADSLWVG